MNENNIWKGVAAIALGTSLLAGTAQVDAQDSNDIPVTLLPFDGGDDDMDTKIPGNPIYVLDEQLKGYDFTNKSPSEIFQYLNVNGYKIQENEVKFFYSAGIFLEKRISVIQETLQLIDSLDREKEMLVPLGLATAYLDNGILKRDLYLQAVIVVDKNATQIPQFYSTGTDFQSQISRVIRGELNPLSTYQNYEPETTTAPVYLSGFTIDSKTGEGIYIPTGNPNLAYRGITLNTDSKAYWSKFYKETYIKNKQCGVLPINITEIDASTVRELSFEVVIDEAGRSLVFNICAFAASPDELEENLSLDLGKAFIYGQINTLLSRNLKGGNLDLATLQQGFVGITEENRLIKFGYTDPSSGKKYAISITVNRPTEFDYLMNYITEQQNLENIAQRQNVINLVLFGFFALGLTVTLGDLMRGENSRLREAFRERQHVGNEEPETTAPVDYKPIAECVRDSLQTISLEDETGQSQVEAIAAQILSLHNLAKNINKYSFDPNKVKQLLEFEDLEHGTKTRIEYLIRGITTYEGDPAKKIGIVRQIVDEKMELYRREIRACREHTKRLEKAYKYNALRLNLINLSQSYQDIIRVFPVDSKGQEDLGQLKKVYASSTPSQAIIDSHQPKKLKRNNTIVDNLQEYSEGKPTQKSDKDLENAARSVSEMIGYIFDNNISEAPNPLMLYQTIEEIQRIVNENIVYSDFKNYIAQFIGNVIRQNSDATLETFETKEDIESITSDDQIGDEVTVSENKSNPKGINENAPLALFILDYLEKYNTEEFRNRPNIEGHFTRQFKSRANARAVVISRTYGMHYKDIRLDWENAHKKKINKNQRFGAVPIVGTDLESGQKVLLDFVFGEMKHLHAGAR